MGMRYNADLSTGDRSQFGDWEWGGTYDGTPPLSQRVWVAKTIDGYASPIPGGNVMTIQCAPGDQFGGSTGWRTIGRLPPERLNGGKLVTRDQGYDSAYTWLTLVPPDWPNDANVWICGPEWHQTNGGVVAPHHIYEYSDRMRTDVYGDNKDAKTNYVDMQFLSGYPKAKWVVFSERYRHGFRPNGAYELWAGIVGVDKTMRQIVKKDGISSMYQGCLNYMLFGTYRAQTGSQTNKMYCGGYREYDLLSEALQWANQILGGGTVTPPKNPPVCTTRPVISGVAEVGQQLTCDEGVWTNSPTFAFQWQYSHDLGASWYDVKGATSKTFREDVTFQDAVIRVVQTGVNADGQAVAYAGFVGPVRAVPGGLKVEGHDNGDGTVTLSWTRVEIAEEYVPTIDGSEYLTDKKRHPVGPRQLTTKIAKPDDGKQHAYGINVNDRVEQKEVTL